MNEKNEEHTKSILKQHNTQWYICIHSGLVFFKIPKVMKLPNKDETKRFLNPFIYSEYINNWPPYNST